MSKTRFAVLVVLGLLALTEADLWRRRPVFTADSAGGAYLAHPWGRSYYCEHGACAPVGRPPRQHHAKPDYRP